MNNYVQDGDTVTIAAPSGGVVKGTAYKVGALLMVALATAAEGADVAMQVTGVITLPKTSAQAWTEGQRVYWDNGNARCDSDATVGQLIGTASGPAANPSSTANVRLSGNAPELLEGQQAAEADLTAITGGESPTEAEHNLVVSKVNAILAKLRIQGIIAT